MKKLLILIIIVISIILASCAPSPASIQEAIAKTFAYQTHSAPTETPTPTITQTPIITPTEIPTIIPTFTPTPRPQMKDVAIGYAELMTMREYYLRDPVINPIQSLLDKMNSAFSATWLGTNGKEDLTLSLYDFKKTSDAQAVFLGHQLVYKSDSIKYLINPKIGLPSDAYIYYVPRNHGIFISYVKGNIVVIIIVDTLFTGMPLDTLSGWLQVLGGMQYQKLEAAGL